MQFSKNTYACGHRGHRAEDPSTRKSVTTEPSIALTNSLWLILGNPIATSVVLIESHTGTKEMTAMGKHTV